MTIELFHSLSQQCSKLTTIRYSTSFSSAIKMLHKDLRMPIFNIYGFVRFADEIVDTFHGFNKAGLLQEFKEDTFDAIDRRISLNPILNSFQQTVNQYEIDHDLIYAFFSSMESDLTQSKYDRQGYDEYIYGSAEVVGLMCLYVFCEGQKSLYEKLKQHAKALGSAFQKINFLRDMKADYLDLSRLYFPGCDFHNFSEKDKLQIENDIEEDFKNAYKGILQLPIKSRFGVYVAYKYYYSLFRKIKSVKPHHILHRRIRISNHYKLCIIFRASLKNGLGLI
jgi:15-cis-phytoene synthase